MSTATASATLLTGTYAWDPETLLITYVDDAGEQQLDRPREDVFEMRLHDLSSVTEESFHRVSALLVERVADKVTCSCYYERRGESGLWRPARAWARAVELPEGRSPQIVCVVRDVKVV